MPKAEEMRRGGAIRYRTIRVGKGKQKRYLHIAIVRKAGPRGGHTVAGPVHSAKKK
jgi:hypothetical protein